MKVRMIIPLEYYVNYILDIPPQLSSEETLKAAIDLMLSGKVDLSDWESDPDFYEGLRDAVKDALHKVEGVEVEEVTEDE